MKVLPQAIATGNIHISTMTGKLKGVMPAVTPSGWRRPCESTPEPTLSVISPLSKCGPPQANSTTSRPRVTSPSASENTLPCSALMIVASSSACFSKRSLNLYMIRALRRGVKAAHLGKASRAMSMAFSTSALEASGTLPETSPVAGFTTSAVRPL